MLGHILPLIPHHRLYVEPFVGGASVLFGKRPALSEVINDVNDVLINFWRCCQTRFDDLQREIRLYLYSERQFHQARELLRNPSDDAVKNAAAFWFVCLTAYLHMHRSATMNMTKVAEHGPQSRVLANKRDSFVHDICDRISTVHIQCKDALDCIRQWDCDDAFFYVDPPYYNSCCCGLGHYTESDYRALLETLSNIKGRFLLSSYPSALLDEAVARNRWSTRQHTCFLHASRRSGRTKTECLTYNYIPPQTEIVFAPDVVDDCVEMA